MTTELDGASGSLMNENPRDLFKRLIVELQPAPVLEIGTLQAIPGRSSHHFGWFPHLARQDYVMVDITPGADVDEIADVHALPSAWTGRFGAFVSEAVFEHLARPWIAAQEIFKVLAPGGLCYTATHQTYPLHAVPKDYFRFSDDALSLIFEDAGFEILSVGYEHRVKVIVPEEFVPAWALDAWNEGNPAFSHVHLIARRPPISAIHPRA
jgi:SAM-dependent methyltransferase